MVADILEREKRDELVLIDTLSPKGQYNESASRSATAPPHGNPPDFYDVAMRFQVREGNDVSLMELALALHHRAGPGEVTVRLLKEGDGSPDVDRIVYQWRAQGGRGVLVLHPTDEVTLQAEAAYWLAISVDEGEVAWMSAYPNLDPQEVTFAERARGTAWRMSKSVRSMAKRLASHRASRPS